MILLLYQKDLTNFSAALLTDKVQQTLTDPASEFRYKTYLTRPVLPTIYLDPPPWPTIVTHQL